MTQRALKATTLPLRGTPPEEGNYRATLGEVLDVVVDIRKSSPTFGQSVSVFGQLCFGDFIRSKQAYILDIDGFCARFSSVQ